MERPSKRQKGRPESADATASCEDRLAPVALDCTSPRAVFAELMAGALRTLGTRPSPPALSYLIGLLDLHVRAPDDARSLERDRTPTHTDGLTDGLLSVLAEGGPDQTSRLRELGDRALFVSGFFGESLRRSVAGLAHYREVGRTAYGRLSSQLACSSSDCARPELFQELADEWGAFVELLAEVAERTRPEAPVDLLGACDRYIETGSERDRARLLRRGVFLPPANTLRRRQ